MHNIQAIHGNNVKRAGTDLKTLLGELFFVAKFEKPTQEVVVW
jgi:hypothetical protein